MEVILRQDVQDLGKAGEIVTVADGYARNFLLPRKLAVRATEKAKKHIEHEIKARASKMEKLADEARKLAEQLREVSCTIKARAGENDRLYGSVTEADVAAALSAQGFNIDRRNIIMDHIKELGVFTAEVKLHRDVSAEVKVWVIKEE